MFSENTIKGLPSANKHQASPASILLIDVLYDHRNADIKTIIKTTPIQ